VILALVLFIGSYIGIVVYKGATRGGLTFASGNKKADANQPPADANTQSEQKPEEPNEAELARPDHNHPAFDERIDERARMVERQIRLRKVRRPKRLGFDANCAAAHLCPPKRFAKGLRRTIRSPIGLGTNYKSAVHCWLYDRGPETSTEL